MNNVVVINVYYFCYCYYCWQELNGSEGKLRNSKFLPVGHVFSVIRYSIFSSNILPIGEDNGSQPANK